MIVGLVSTREATAKRFGVQVPEELEYSANYNLHPGDECIFLSSQKPNEFVRMRYGMIPFWTKDEKLYYHAPMEGSKHEGSFKKEIILDPVFRKPIRGQRGLLPVDYFIVETESGTPYLVYLKEKKQRPIALACVWDTWKKEIKDDLSIGFSILTTPAYGKFEKIGVKRMPMIMNDANCRKWIKTNIQLTEITHMFCLFDDKDLNAFPISPEILTNRENDKKLIEARGEVIDKPEPRILMSKQAEWFHHKRYHE